MNARTKKSAAENPTTIEVTPELHDRAVQFLADRMIDLAGHIGRTGVHLAHSRVVLGLQPSEAHIVHEVSAQMALEFAKQIANGDIEIKRIYKDADQGTPLPGMDEQ